MRRLRQKIKKNFFQSTRRLTWMLYRKKRILLADCRKLIDDRMKKGNVKLHLCCGGKKYKDYINVDIVPLEGADVTMNIPKDLFLVPSNVASEILIENGFEHFYRYEQDDLLRECHRILKDKGRLVIKGIPDFDLIADAYMNKKKGNVSAVFDLYEVYRITHGDPTPANSPHQLHKDMFTKDIFRRLLARHGFNIEDMSDKVFQGENTAVGFNVIAVK